MSYWDKALGEKLVKKKKSNQLFILRTPVSNTVDEKELERMVFTFIAVCYTTA